MSFWDRLTGKEKDKKYSIVVGGVEMNIDINIDRHGTPTLNGISVLGKKMNDFQISEKMLKIISSVDSNLINLDNEVFLSDNNNRRTANRIRKMLNQNMELIIDVNKKDKNMLKNLLDNDSIKDNKLKEIAVNYYSVPDGYFGKMLFYGREKLHELKELSYGNKYVEPDYLRAYNLSQEEKKKANKKNKELTETKDSEVFKVIQEMASVVSELQKEIIALKSQRNEIKQSENVNHGHVEQNNDHLQHNTNEKINQTQRRQSKTKIKNKPFTPEQQQVYNDVMNTHKTFLELMKKNGGMTREDYEGKFGLNTIKKQIVYDIKNTTDIDTLRSIRENGINKLGNCYSNAIETNEAKSVDSEKVSGGSEVYKKAESIVEKNGGNVETVPENINNAVLAMSKGLSIDEIKKNKSSVIEPLDEYVDPDDIHQYIDIEEFNEMSKKEEQSKINKEYKDVLL